MMRNIIAGTLIAGGAYTVTNGILLADGLEGMHAMNAGLRYWLWGAWAVVVGMLIVE